MTCAISRAVLVVALCSALSVSARAAQLSQGLASDSGSAAPITTPPLPLDFVIGPEDVLSIVFWREKEMSSEVVVRPDGKISLPLLKDVQAAGYTPEELTTVLVNAASKYISQPNATVIVKEINSRKVFVVGQVAKPGAFALTRELTVLEVIAMAGDVLEYAKSRNIVVSRKDGEGERRLRFNYKGVMAGKHIEQNIKLKPGDTVIVP